MYVIALAEVLEMISGLRLARWPRHHLRLSDDRPWFLPVENEH
jgi:hypothetical protein